ncbi:ParB/RepB/Spo0J family partition protein [Staphylococcus haemolyticus]|uniref:ParB/RepB/Spo0J family partition protein n=1 Tax=Staphylococcus haemolyticus TaxID=1283 RepID=UPI00069CE021|nr:ParB/RepB/Spo0J family partition protein [Staphylococcus haemolyticus]SIJ90354.1 chromosome partitioning protein ParB [Mycobacteroides abscessus subsp. abscessus]MBE7355639.1 ParB/RepB/Spo0J family partition protein [Staphylococcus haemolyticus]MDT0705766.1 ParB/RepB/Spo0J family partition protein [Staphylococcus haemolyticus]MDT0723813.1 ParB/RepB/Spo0J family partition protein [Staphylococcus haemolyticus]MDT0738787.1 ParB/RepB/Spo0J family partition protein [Staphylococcus haemolyticus]
MGHKQDERLAISQNEQIQKIDLSKIKANPYQPRKTFDDDRLSDLATSIQTHGVLQPIVLRQTVQGYYIVVGERRFRASQLAGLNEIPAIIKELSDSDMMELAIIENLQREDLNAIEEAESYQRLMNDLGLTQQKVAERLGKSRPYIANMLRLLNLPKDISNQVKEGALSSAHGRTLLGIKDVTMMKKISQQAIRENWSVRYLEQVVNELQDGGQSKKSKATTQIKPKFIQKQERRLKEKFGSKVDISTSKNIGKITFEFKTEEEFKRLIQKLNDEV